jgi:hypothetical protein
MARKKIFERLKDWFGGDSEQRKAKKRYHKGEASHLWDSIPEEKKEVKYHYFQSILSLVWKKTERGGKRPRSGNKKKS